MKTFKDNKKRTWGLEVNMFTVKKVIDLLGVNIVDLKNDEVISKIKDDMIFVIDVIYVLCMEQVKEQNLTEEDFAKGLMGDALENAVATFIEAWTDFFPEATRKRLMSSQKLSGNVMNKMWGEVDKTLKTYRTASQ